MTIIGGYEIQSRLHDDGVSQTYAARDVESGLAVGLVCFPVSEEIDTEAYSAIQRECALVSEIEGVPLLPIVSYGLSDDCAFYVTPAWAQNTLVQRLQKGAFSWEEAVFVLQRVAQALDKLHSLGIIHGDLKPAHIHFDSQGRAFLGGIGRHTMLQARQRTWPGTVAGPLGYRSPEHDLSAQDLTPASDVYALGVLGYQMLSGQLPFTANNLLGWRLQHLVTPVPDVRTLRGDVPESAARSLQRALHKNPAARFDTAIAFAQAFGGKPVAPQRRIRGNDDAFWEQHFAPSKKRTFNWQVALLLVMMLLVSAGLWGISRSTAHFLPPLQMTTSPNLTMAGRMTPVPPTASPGVTKNPQATPTLTGGAVSLGATSTPTVAAPPTAQVRLLSQGTATPTGTAPPEVPLVFDTPLPGGSYEIQYGDNVFSIAAALGLNQGVFMGANGLSCDSYLYPGKTLLVPPPGIVQYEFPQVAITARNITALQTLYVPECVREVGDVAFSPDGQVLAIAQKNTILLWLVSEWHPWRQLRGHRMPVTRLRYAPDGSLLVSAGNDGTVFVWQAADGTEVRNFRAHNGEITDAAFSPHGEWLVTTALDQRVVVWQVSDWSKAREMRGYVAYSAAFSPDGSLLAVGYSDKVALMETKDFQVVREMPAESVPHNLAFSPDGVLLASNSDLWQVSDGRHIYHWPESTHRIAFTRDGQALVVGQKIWHIPNGLPAGSLTLDIDQTVRAAYAMDSVAFSSDYRLLAVGTQDGVVILGMSPDVSVSEPLPQTYRLQPGDNYMNVAASLDLPLSTLLSANDLTCEHVPFISQALMVSEPAKPWSPSLLPLYAENVSKITELATLENHCALPRGRIAFSPARDTLVSGISLWSLRMKSLLMQGTDLSQMPLDASTVMPEAVLQFSPDGRLVAEPVGGDIRLWNAADGRLVRTISAHQGRITELVFDLGGQILASSSVDKTIHLWRVADGTLLDTIPGYVAEVLLFTPDGKTLISVAGDTARFWPIEIQGNGAQIEASVLNKQSGEPRFTFQGLLWVYHLSPDGNSLGYVACLDGTPEHCNEQVLNILSVNDGVIKHTFPGVKKIIQDFAFSPDSTQVAIVTENAIAVWDIRSESSVTKLLGDRKLAEYIDQLFYTPDGKMIVTMVNQAFLRFWALPSGQEVGKVSIPGIRFVTMSSDQYMLAALVGENITLWGVEQ